MSAQVGHANRKKGDVALVRPHDVLPEDAPRGGVRLSQSDSDSTEDLINF